MDNKIITTDYPLEIYNLLNKTIHNEDDFLLKYQKLVKEYVFKHSNRGILINFDVGYGKSITAASIAEEFRTIENRQIIVLSALSLHENFKKAIRQYRNSQNKYTNKNKDQKMNNEEMNNDEMNNDEMNNNEMNNNEMNNNETKGENENNEFSSYQFITMNSSNMIKKLGITDTNDEIFGKFINKFTKAEDLNNKCIIVDEAHNLFNGIVNGSKNSTEFYNLVMGAKNIKLVFLSGTPVVNHPFELVPCFNMLYGPIESSIKLKNTKSKKINSEFRYETLLPEDWDIFNKYFIKDIEKSQSVENIKDIENYEESIKTINNKEKFQARILGLSAYYGDKFSQIKLPNKLGIPNEDDKFPYLYPLHIVKIPMSKEQNLAYDVAREIEIDEDTKKFKGTIKNVLMRPTSNATSTYRVRSRQIGNVFISNSDSNSNLNSDSNSNLNLNLNETYIKFWTNIDNDENKEKFNKIENKVEYLKQIKYLSPKTQFILDDIDKKPRQTKVIYSAFVKNTLKFVEKCLLLKNFERIKFSKDDLNNVANFSVSNFIRRLNINLDSKTKSNINSDSKTNILRYAILSGDVESEERDLIMKVMSSDENMYGDIINIVLLSSAGSEGLDFRNVRNIYIFEPHWNYARIRQIIARVVRYESHIKLPIEERNVNAYLLLSIESHLNNKKNKNLENSTSKNLENSTSKNLEDSTSKNLEDSTSKKLSTDETLWDRSLKNKLLIDKFINAIIETSINCNIYNKNDKITCFLCKPDGNKLFDLDFDKDINIKSPCILTKIDDIYNKSEKIKVDEIKINGVKYYVDKNTNNKNPNIYIFDNKLNGYVEIDSKTYSEIIEYIN